MPFIILHFCVKLLGYLVKGNGIFPEDTGRDNSHLVAHEASTRLGCTGEEACKQDIDYLSSNKHITDIIV